MAKIFFFNVPAHGHVNPTLPVVRELVQQGHQVIYYNAEAFEGATSATGAEFRSYPDSSVSEAELSQRIHNLASVSVYLLEESYRLLPVLLDEIEREKPDLILFDSIALWGMLASRIQNIPSVASISIMIYDGVPGILRWQDYLYIFRKAFTQLPSVIRSRRQLVKTYGPAIFPTQSILPCRGDLNILYTSRQFHPETPFVDHTFRFVGPSILPATRAETGFPWECLEPDRRKVYLSLGTLYNENLDFYRQAFLALSNHPAQFILSVGSSIDLKDIGPVPDNFVIQSHVPQLELLQKVDLFVTHGGMNSINEALYYGVPLIVVPQQIEQAMNGRQVARLGAGVVLGDTPPYGQIDARILRESVDQVFTSPNYRLNAGRLSRSFHEAGGYGQAAKEINALLA